MKYCAFYGSLKTGRMNYGRFSNFGEQKHIQTIKLNGYELYDFGPYPACCEVEDKTKEVTIEIHAIDDKVYNYIDGMERGAGYFSKKIFIDNLNEDATIYLQTKESIFRSGGKLVESGNW